MECVENFIDIVFHAEDITNNLLGDLHVHVGEEQEGMGHYKETHNGDFSIIGKIPTEFWHLSIISLLWVIQDLDLKV